MTLIFFIESYAEYISIERIEYKETAGLSAGDSVYKRLASAFKMSWLKMIKHSFESVRDFVGHCWACDLVL